MLNLNYNNEEGNIIFMQDHPITKLKEDYNDLYNDLIAIGKTKEESLAICKKLQEEESKYLSTVKNIDIKLEFLIEDLNKHIDWYSYSKEEQAEILWGLGMDTTGNKFFYQTRLYYKEGNKKAYGTFVYGAERLDDEWLTKRYDTGEYCASEEARDFQRNKDDPEYFNTIRRLLL